MHSINHVVVIGAGTMGAGVAHVSAGAGYKTVLYDIDDSVLTRGMDRVRKNLEKGIARGKVTEAAREATLGNLSAASGTLDDVVKNADLVIEAVPEILDLKCSIFEGLGNATPEHAVLATNTSSLPVKEIANASRRASHVVGMHFFNPVHLMKLLELVKTDASSPDVVAATTAVGEAMGKTVVVVNDSPGFATSRLGLVLGLEAIRMVEEGVASAKDIDTALELGYRHPMGPLKLTDLVGLDVRLGIAEHLSKVLDDRRFDPPQLLRDKVAAGHLGKKSGKGFYEWEA